MKVALLIARRYFLAKKKKNFINILSLIAMGGVAIGSCALIVVLSAFNGLEGLFLEMFSKTDPEIRIEAVQGKTFKADTSIYDKISEIEGVEAVYRVLEDNTILKHKKSMIRVRLRGVEQDYVNDTEIGQSLVQGSFDFNKEDTSFVVPARGIQLKLGIPFKNQVYPLEFWYPKRGKGVSINPMDAFTRRYVLPGGFMEVNDNKFDNLYVLSGIDFAASLFSKSGELSSYELEVGSGYKQSDIKSALQNMLPDSFKVSTQKEIHSGMFRAIRIERLFLFGTFTFILIISSVNIFFALSLLSLEKKRDVGLLKSMGGTKNLILKIFLSEGLFIGLLGGLFGLALGFGLCFIQQRFGIVSMNMQSAIVKYYPVEMNVTDFLLVFSVIVISTIIASIYPSLKSSRLTISQGLKSL